MCFLSPIAFPVKGFISEIFSISSPQNSTLTALSLCEDGYISAISPFALKVPRLKSISFLEYCISTNFFKTSSLLFCIPGLKDNIIS